MNKSIRRENEDCSGWGVSIIEIWFGIIFLLTRLPRKAKNCNTARSLSTTINKMTVLPIRMSVWEKNLVEKLSSERNCDVSGYAKLILIGFDPNSTDINSPASRVRFLCGMQGLLGIIEDADKCPIVKNKMLYSTELVDKLKFELQQLKKRVVTDEVVNKDIQVQRVLGDDQITAVSIRLLPNEMAKIKRDAKTQGLFTNQYIRNSLKNRRLPSQLAGVNEKINQDLILLRSELIQGECNIRAWLPILRSC
jgi:predicted DNA binding CopG/RHH family protein